MRRLVGDLLKACSCQFGRTAESWANGASNPMHRKSAMIERLQAGKLYLHSEVACRSQDVPRPVMKRYRQFLGLLLFAIVRAGMADTIILRSGTSYSGELGIR